MPIIPIRWVASDPGKVKRVLCLITDTATGDAFDGRDFVQRDDGRFIELTPEPMPGLFSGEFEGDPATFIPSVYFFTYFDPDDSYRPLGFMLFEIADRSIPDGWYYIRTHDRQFKDWVYISTSLVPGGIPDEIGGSDG